ncbi:MAG: Lytic transglycosylase, catalytic [Frankiales bacterium]|nr:Lytic transglycosylase, catalytic [Frankiales bacterium]
MSVDMTGMADIQSRIASIQSRFGQVQAGTARGTASSGTASSTGFADALASYTSPSSATAGNLSVTGTSMSGAVGGDAVVADAKRYLGVPYVWGGTDPASGLDCSGLVQRVFKDLGIDVPRVADDQARAGQPVASLADARPGDLVAFGSPVDHIGIYAGNNTMVVAPKTGDVVKVQTIYRTPTAIRRIVPDTALATAATAQLPAGSTPTLASAPAAFRGLFTAAGARYGVSPDLLAAVARAESGFDPQARSGAGAIGLMQIMPGTAKGLGIDPGDPAQAVDGAARLLADGLRSYNGSVSLALAAYNAGPGAVSKYGGIPPYPETQAYVQRVQSYLQGAAA